MPRPKGRRNNKTLMREETIAAITKRAQGFLIHEVQGVLETVVKKAKEGDMTAAKLILDRAIPARRSIDELPGANKAGITINIVASEVTANEHQNTYESPPDLERSLPALGQGGAGSQGSEEFPEHGSEAGEKSH